MRRVQADSDPIQAGSAPAVRGILAGPAGHGKGRKRSHDYKRMVMPPIDTIERLLKCPCR